MDEQKIIQRISVEVCQFIYKNYFLDEISLGNDVLIYCQGDTMVFSITNCGDHFDFLIMFNEEEQAELEARRSEFPPGFIHTYNPIHYGETGMRAKVTVSDMESWDNAKRLMLIKMEPNREPWPDDARIKSVNGGRCDMCVHYIHHTSDDEDFKKYVKSLLDKRWGDNCGHDIPCYGQKKDCGGLIHVSLPFGMNTSADMITYAILPYVKDLM